ncbi:MAG: hypothetical protein H6707_12325 [Deltaproteobacteria bacterium]|nr:hypothetical protein [Deltaproteobacteria bacterium]
MAHAVDDADHAPDGAEHDCSGSFHLCSCHVAVAVLHAANAASLRTGVGKQRWIRPQDRVRRDPAPHPPFRPPTLA